MNTTQNPTLATIGRRGAINRRVAILAAAAAALVGIGMSNPVHAQLVNACPILIGPNPVDVVKVDVDANPRISQAFNIMSIPTIAFFRPGQQPLLLRRRRGQHGGAHQRRTPSGPDPVAALGACSRAGMGLRGIEVSFVAGASVRCCGQPTDR